MPRIRLIHWHAEEARSRASCAGGHTVTAGPLTGPGSLREIAAQPPDAFVIDLTRLPSHGRDVALGFRSYRATRRVPIVFAEGDPDKVAKIRALLPDATYTAWSRIRGARDRRLPIRRSAPVPASNPAGYRARLREEARISPIRCRAVGAPPTSRTRSARSPGRWPRGAARRADDLVHGPRRNLTAPRASPLSTATSP
jgi:hypothetical protein